ncbi:von Willebrand factor type A domain-containing protein [Marinilongibacter aquaticus]|uniref:vWA domain-containing protein n=1 Tax=Marinilongibacter aquaticus TaxID=2975157 RepID=UPI0021BD8B66|nr:VWA domain-containing protein [Marinilongibacter aquaticus]UBM57788.1 von Willebrand factor type A domain-containing protein [Marinilongibacter aquaticus]
MKNLFVILFCLCMAQNSQAQDSILAKGFVYDETGNRLPGANLIEKGTSHSTYTDSTGYFEFSVTKHTILCAFVGYSSKTVEVENGKTLHIRLEPDSYTLDEVVVVGYGVQRKKASQGNFTQVSPAYEEYAHVRENGFISTQNQALTTFAADVDRASYSNIRRFINSGNLPPKDAVRIEEMINYFDYDYKLPSPNEALLIETTLSSSPFNEDLELLRVSLQTPKMEVDNLPPSNLVFLVDVSGSMQSANKLPLLKKSFQLLVSQLREQDRVALVTYAGHTHVALASTSGKEKEKIMAALDALEASGSTAGASGIELAYAEAENHLLKKGNNRVILATDGDFNVGVSSVSGLEKLIEAKRQSGIFLSVLGFGMGNYKDEQMETLADKGNGNYNYIDNLQEARKVFIREFGGTLYTVAKDVKIQIEFNPALVAAYRLIGYENRLLNAEDFEDDNKDAGDLGSGHTMTALYEIIPQGVDSPYLSHLPKLKYTRPSQDPIELMHLKIRYKKPSEKKSTKLEMPVKKVLIPWETVDNDFRFSAAVAEFGLLLKDSAYKGGSNFTHLLSEAQKAKGQDTEGQRSEFIQLAKLAEKLNQTLYK